MSFSIGIIGFPNAGKSTLFKALTRQKVDIAPYPFTTIKPNEGIVEVPDQRLTKLKDLLLPDKATPTIIKFVDIAGLIKGAHKGEGLGNQFLAQIRNCDALIEVIRGFINPEVERKEGDINPQRDIEIISAELLMKDRETLKGTSAKIEDNLKQDKSLFKKSELIKKIETAVSQGELISQINLNEEERLELKEYQLLTAKPRIYLLNVSESEKEEQEKQAEQIRRFNLLRIDLKLEEESSELSQSEAKELGIKSNLDQLILSCYNALDLITFFTATGGKEIRAWTLKNGSEILEAAGKVHSDFKEKFVRAEAISWQKLVEAQSWARAKEMGWIKTVGKEHIVEDGEIIEFKI